MAFQLSVHVKLMFVFCVLTYVQYLFLYKDSP